MAVRGIYYVENNEGTEKKTAVDPFLMIIVREDDAEHQFTIGELVDVGMQARQTRRDAQIDADISKASEELKTRKKPAENKAE